MGEVVIAPAIAGSILYDILERSKRSKGQGQSKLPADTQRTPPNDEDPKDKKRKKNISKAESKIWKNLKTYKRNVKTNGKKGSKKQFYQWDHTHNDIEVFDHNEDHYGSMDPTTGKIYKKPVKGRELNF